jgi:hypothetical protein
MSEDVTSPPNFIFKKPNGGRKKEECIVDLVASSAAGVGRIGLAAAVDSSAGCVSVMIFRINKELVSQGWKISSTKLNGQPGRRGAPAAAAPSPGNSPCCAPPAAGRSHMWRKYRLGACDRKS